MKKILKRFASAPWPQKLAFILFSPVLLAFTLVCLVFGTVHFAICTTYKIVTGDELYD